MDMEIIQSAASEMLVNVVLAVIALAGAYAVYYLRVGASAPEAPACLLYTFVGAAGLIL